MAKISPNENAPAEVTYILPTATFDLAEGGSFETDDRTVLADAEAHPWLTVTYPELEELDFQRPEKAVPYDEDYLSAAHSVAFDADEIRKVEEAKYEAEASRLAVDAGLDQGDEEHVGEVGVTLAADDRSDETLSQAPEDNPYSPDYVRPDVDEDPVEPTTTDGTED